MLAQQQSLIDDLESLEQRSRSMEPLTLPEFAALDDRRPGGHCRAPDLPAELVSHYRELLRTYVIMGSGNLARELGCLAELLTMSGVNARETMQLHLHVLEELLQGLGVPQQPTRDGAGGSADSGDHDSLGRGLSVALSGAVESVFSSQHCPASTPPPSSEHWWNGRMSEALPLDATTTVAELRRLVAEFVDLRDWQQFHSPKNLSMSLAIEAAELMEHFQWLTVQQSRELTQQPDKLAEVADELADVLSYALAMANQLEIDLSGALRDKMAKNERKYPADEYRGRFGPEDR